MTAEGPLPRIAALHDLALVVLYGSAARGDGRPGSDVDVGVLRRDGARLTYRQLAALYEALVPVFGEGLDLADLATDDAIFRREVARDGRVLFEGEDGRWVELVTHALIDYADIARDVEACVAGVALAASRAAATGR